MVNQSAITLGLWPAQHQSHNGPAGPIVSDWAQLYRGDRVIITGLRGQRYSGTVDDIAFGGYVLWLILDHGAGRKLFLHADVHSMTFQPPPAAGSPPETAAQP